MFISFINESFSNHISLHNPLLLQIALHKSEMIYFRTTRIFRFYSEKLAYLYGTVFSQVQGVIQRNVYVQ